MTYTIHLVESNGNTIEENTFWHNVLSGIFIGENSSNNLIDFNNVNISTNSNDNGLEIERNAGGNNSILHNNFLCSVSSDVRSRWYGNYYEHRIGHNARILFLCPKIILPIILIYPVINVDWHPAQKPYDIPI